MKKLGWPLTLSILLFLVFAILSLTGQDLVEKDTLRYLLAACLASLSVVLVRALGYVLFDVIFQRRKGREAPALLRVLLSIIGYSILFMLIYNWVFDRSLSGIMTTSAVVTVIIGLALQDTLGNFFAGLSFHIEQPFHIGDAIRVGEMIGRVEAVTWRTTAVRTNNNTTIIFPNSLIARDALEVYPYNNLNRRVLIFPAPYSIPPERVIALVREAVRTVPKVATEMTPVVRIGSFADSAINYEILYWVIDYMWVPDLDAKIRERIWYIFHRSGIQIPFPTSHVLFEQLEPAAKVEELDYNNVIEQVDILEPLTAEEREEIVKALVKYVYAPGEVILRRGDPGDSMFIISRGKAEVRLPSTNGDLKQVAVLEPGNFFGEMALFTGEPRTADVNALEEVEVLEIRKSSIEQLFCQNSKLAEAFSHKIAERQAKLDEYSRKVSEDERQMQRESILRRIKRFFSLG